MATTPEHKVKKLVRECLHHSKAYVFSPVQTGMGARTLDLLCSHRGRFLAIECKAPGKRLTPQQQAIRVDIEEAGGRVIMIDTTDTSAPCWEELTDWLATQKFLWP